jgi:MFS family permease
MNVSAGLIGLNAAMPALGWLFASIILPRLHQRFSLKQILIGFILTSMVGLIGLWGLQHYNTWLWARLLFGGGIGMFFRTVEFWINAHGDHSSRGQMLGGYSACFILGIMIGSILQPELGNEGLLPFSVIFGSLVLTLIMAVSLDLTLPKRQRQTSQNTPALGRVFAVAPVALAGVQVYGFFEDVPAYLLSVYALKVGFAEDVAAYTLSAVAMGILLFSVPLGWLSDRLGRMTILIAGSFVGLSGAVLIPIMVRNATLFLVFLVIWGGAIGSIYSVSQASIGDKFNDQDLISTNASFGIIYGAAALVGPLANGLTMQLWEPNGLMLSSALTFGLFLLAIIPLHRKMAHE